MRAPVAGLGLALLTALLLPPLRPALEAGMSLQMLVQFPALMLAGALLAAALPAAWRLRLSAWNASGLSGLTAVGLILTLLMIPRLLDLALVEPKIELAKVLALLLAGAVLGPSWRRAGLVLQGFFLGNLLMMMVLVGTLYQDAPQRLCNAYRLDDQQQLGLLLVWGSAAAGLLWLLRVLRRLSGPGRPARQSGHAKL